MEHTNLGSSEPLFLDQQPSLPTNRPLVSYRLYHNTHKTDGEIWCLVDSSREESPSNVYDRFGTN
jgi:hypothetical protein